MAKDNTKTDVPPQPKKIPLPGSNSALKLVEEPKAAAEPVTSIDKAIEEAMPSLEDIANMSLGKCDEWHDDKSFIDDDK